MNLTSFSVVSLSVTQEGTAKVAPIRRFEDAGLHPVMLENVKLAGYRVPTPIQQYCLPAVKTGHDVVACAQTGKLCSWLPESHERSTDMKCSQVLERLLLS